MKYPNSVIKMGSTASVYVKAIKKQLNELGYANLDVKNGNFGEQTEQAVKTFQTAMQLNDDGIVGKLTWERLFEGRPKVDVTSNVLRLRALEIANTQLHVREKSGKNDGAEVGAYLKSIGLGEGYAWCMAFVYWCFKKAAEELGIDNPLPKTGGVLEHFRRSKAIPQCKVIHDDPQPGDIGIMDFGGGLGHTFIVERRVSKDVETVEGNTNEGGSRNGDGVYERLRPINKVKAFLRYE